MKLKPIFLALLLMFAMHAGAQQPQNLPFFTFSKLDGKIFSNKDLNPKKANLFMLFDCTCEHCQREAKLLNTNYAKFKDVNIYMITLDEAFIIPQFFNTYAKGLDKKPNVTILQDKKGVFIPTFLPEVYPGLYLYAADGKLLVYHAGDGSVAKILKKMK